MNDRILNLKKNIQLLNDEGVRKILLYELAGDALKDTEGEPKQIRRAKAFAYVLEHVEQEVHPYELIAGTMTGLCPVYSDVPTIEEQEKEAVKIIEEYREKKAKSQNFDGAIQFTEGHAKSFEEDMGSRKSRWSLMSRVLHDTRVPFHQLQKLITKIQERYKDTELEPYEIGRELERAFKIPYEKEKKERYDQLPWFIGNHLSLNYWEVLKTGLDAKRSNIETYLKKETDPEKKEFYQAQNITVNAVIAFIRRYAQTLRMYSEQEGTSTDRAMELHNMADICENIATKPAKSFHEAVQLTWMLHIIANIQGGSALSFGRMDQYLNTYYEKDKAAGIINEEQAVELLSCLWLKVNEPRMRTVQSVTLGGITRDGKDAVNEMTRLCLKTAEDVSMPYPNVGLRINPVNPTWVYEAALDTVKAGCGQPMLLNDNIWIPNLIKLGYSREDASDYYNMGCVEIMIPGKQPNWGVTEAIAFPVFLENVMTKWKAGEVKIDTYDDYMKAYYAEMDAAIYADYIEAVGKRKNLDHQCYDPYSSMLIDGCLENGADMLQEGSELPMHWCVYGYGIGTVADSLCAVKKFVFDEKRISMEDLYWALKNNYEGYEEMQAMLLNETPHYGNGIDEVDDIADEVLSHFSDKVMELNDKPGDDKFVSTLFGYFFHIYHGEIAEATPDGRGKGEPFSDSMGPSQGKDEKGPTRLFNSVLHLNDENITGGYALNFKINPSFLNEEKGKKALVNLLQAYIENGGPQIQAYTTKIEDLQDAQVHPDKHRDLIVRVGGYCEFFVNLDKVLQAEIINRTLFGEA